MSIGSKSENDHIKRGHKISGPGHGEAGAEQKDLSIGSSLNGNHFKMLKEDNVAKENKNGKGGQEQPRRTRVAKGDKSSKGGREQQRRTRVEKEDPSSKGTQE